MPESPLAKKLKLKPGMHAAVVNAPSGYLDELKPLPDGAQIEQSLSGRYDWIQLFVKNRAELESVIKDAAGALGPDSMLWISFPKGSSKIQTDLTRDKGWESPRAVELKWINLISVNETWSAFSLRPYKPGEARQSFR